ncbi:sulfate transporter subunit [Labrys sp. WJW]|uniref:sulfate ABC transporter substrate-binding protein n=1 Tax=Labrys sp. WJW TaxID=1737983 RepID=UPI00082F925F|nr:sulfate transporter subunit [Labrys sp. WJW]
MTSLTRLRDTLTVLLALGFVLWMTFGAPSRAHATELLNVSYDATRELYKEINKAFAADWKAKTGEDLTIKQSHAGSGKQARAVIDGLDADVVTLALSNDIDSIAKATKKIPENWQSRLPRNSTPYASTIVFVVRKGNPKGIKDWGDLVRPDVAVITGNPKTGGGTRWNYLAAWGYAWDKTGGDEDKTRDFVAALYRNVPVLDSAARGATITFAQREVGDVMIAWENEAFLTLKEFGEDKLEVVVPSISILAEPPVSIVDANVDAKGTRKQAEAYLNFLYTPAAQKIIAHNGYRASDEAAADPVDLARFAKLKLFTISEPQFGGWAKVQAKHFADGGIFDQIYKPKG